MRLLMTINLIHPPLPSDTITLEPGILMRLATVSLSNFGQGPVSIHIPIHITTATYLLRSVD